MKFVLRSLAVGFFYRLDQGRESSVDRGIDPQFFSFPHERPVDEVHFSLPLGQDILEHGGKVRLRRQAGVFHLLRRILVGEADSLRPGNPQFSLHMAEVYEKKGLRDEAFRLADPLLSQPALMDPDSYEELRALIKRLRPSS